VEIKARVLSQSDTAISELEDRIGRLQQVSSPERQTRAEFEVAGMDVVIGCRSAIGGVMSYDYCGQIHVECKPLVGDDYPAILRQITAARATVMMWTPTMAKG
jgi:hypothetical protein